MSASQSLVLVVNCGSSSLKFVVVPAGGGAPLVSGLAECLGLPDSRLTVKIDGRKDEEELAGAAHEGALAALMKRLDKLGLMARIGVVGHRMVHGGERFTASTLITPAVIADVEALSDLAPLHNPVNLLGVRSCMKLLPDIPQVAVFDTAFHQTMPPAAYAYAIPQSFYRDQGVRRYGFHGTSHRYVSGEAVRILGLDPNDHGLVVAHLGNGCSATAVVNGKSVDTTMGMTPLEGLVMGTRSGDLDFGAAAYMGKVAGLDLVGMESLLNKKSGLLGLSELSSDCRDLQSAADAGNAGAKLALDVFVHRLARHIGGLATSLTRFDALVFTGGIGENSAPVRAATLKRLALFGFVLDEDANARTSGGRSGVIAAGKPCALVVPTDEEGLIARDAARIGGLLDANAASGAGRA